MFVDASSLPEHGSRDLQGLHIDQLKATGHQLLNPDIHSLPRWTHTGIKYNREKNTGHHRDNRVKQHISQELQLEQIYEECLSELLLPKLCYHWLAPLC